LVEGSNPSGPTSKRQSRCEPQIGAPPRRDNELPPVIVNHGWQFHHVGIPTQSVRPGETYLPTLKMYVSGFEFSPFGIQWMRFENDSPFPEIVKTIAHVAFEVDDLAAALQGREVLVQPNCPSPGVTVAMIVDDGAPVELLEFRPPVRVAPRNESV
jgi:hypothetical protein